MRSRTSTTAATHHISTHTLGPQPIKAILLNLEHWELVLGAFHHISLFSLVSQRLWTEKQNVNGKLFLKSFSEASTAQEDVPQNLIWHFPCKKVHLGSAIGMWRSRWWWWGDREYICYALDVFVVAQALYLYCTV